MIMYDALKKSCSLFKPRSYKHLLEYHAYISTSNQQSVDISKSRLFR